MGDIISSITICYRKYGKGCHSFLCPEGSEKATTLYPTIGFYPSWLATLFMSSTPPAYNGAVHLVGLLLNILRTEGKIQKGSKSIFVLAIFTTLII